MADEAPNENLRADEECETSEAHRTIEELLHARMDQLERIIEKLIEQPERLTDRFGKLLSIVEVLAESHAEVRSDFLELKKEYEQFRKDTEEALKSLADNQSSGEDRLHAMLTIVDDLIRNRPNDPPKTGSAGI